MTDQPIDLSGTPPVTKPLSPGARTIGVSEHREASKPTQDKPAEKPLPSSDPEALFQDLETKDTAPKDIYIDFPPRSYPCYDGLPAYVTIKVQRQLSTLAERFAGKKEGDITPAQAAEMMESFEFLVDTLEHIVLEDGWEELKERLRTQKSPYGRIDLWEVLDPIMKVIGSYSNRDSGKR